MTSGTPKLGGSQQPLRLAGLLTGLFVTILVVTIAAAFWREIRGLAWPWQVGVGALALWIVLKAFTAGRNPEKAQVEMADVVYRAGRYEEALVLVGKILSVCPTNSEAFYLKGQCLHRLDREEEAMAAWLESIKHNPAHCKAAHRLGCEQENRGDYLKAAEYFTIAREAGAMAEGPDTFQQNIESTKQALTQAGRRAEQTDAREAIKYIDAFVKLEPTHAIAHAWRGHKQFLLGDYDAAIRDAEVCLRLDPKYRKASELIQAAQAKLNAEAAREQLDVTGQVALRGPGSSGLPFTTTTPSSTEVTTRVKLEEGKPPTIGTDAATLWRPRDKAFDRYEVRKIVGGGFGTVYCAWDLKTNLPVALKAIRLDTVIDKATARQAFRREAQYWRSLGNHPHIVELLSVEKFQYRHLILVMEYVAGEPTVGPTLRHHLKAKRQLPIDDAVRLAVNVCRAMEFAYETSKLVHRDLKPENVFVTVFGRAKVGDFGLATIEGERVEFASGTSPYMAPEQFEENEPASVRMDIYAMGVLMYEMLGGIRPIPPNGEVPGNKEGWAYHHGHSRPHPLGTRSPDIPDGLAAIVEKCLAKKPVDRFQTFRELRDALRPFSTRSDTDESGGPMLVDEEDLGVKAFNAGVTADSLDYFEESLAHYRQAVRHEPFRSKRSDAWCNMGKVLAQMRRFPEALTAYDRALSVDPGDQHALLGRANVAAKQGSESEALGALDKLVRVFPDNADVHASKGILLLRLGRPEEAEECFAAARSRNDRHHFAINGLGMCAIARGNHREALEYFDLAIRINEEFADAHANRSEALTRLERHADAYHSAARSVEIQPENSGCRTVLGMALANIGYLPEAIAQLLEAVRLDPLNGWACAGLAKLYRECGELEKARKWAASAVRLGHPVE